ncbi:MAG TPA: hypothetical protein DCG57_03470 [Candidatus Riflebacteria bacterium]|nr:hypothetical protein [Candidatus Riflebacteria bacterium]
MKMRVYGVVLAILLVATAFTGCGGGGGGGGVADTSADQLLASQLIGTWKLSQASKDGVLVEVKPNTANQVGTITFSSDNTAASVDYTITTSVIVGVGGAPDTNFYQTEDTAPTISGGSWAVANETLITTNSSGQTFTNAIQITDSKLYQTMSDGDVRVWTKV